MDPTQILCQTPALSSISLLPMLSSNTTHLSISFSDTACPLLPSSLSSRGLPCFGGRLSYNSSRQHTEMGKYRLLASGQVSDELRTHYSGCKSLRKSQFCRRNDPFVPSHRRSPMQVHALKKTFSTFDDLLSSSELPLLVDFYATWCGPCQFMVPILDNVGDALRDEIRIVKIDTEKYPSIASRYGVQALPTFILFHNGTPIDRLEGALSAPELIQRIQERLSTSKEKRRE
eukprot:c24511_g1_i1 orf=923-1615(-)